MVLSVSRTRALVRLRPSVTQWRVREGWVLEGDEEVSEDNEVRCEERSLMSEGVCWFAASSE